MQGPVDSEVTTVTLPVRDDLAAVAETRAAARAALGGRDLPEGLVRDVLLVISELTTNALVHGRAPAQVRLRRTARDLVVEVHDATNSAPRLLRPDSEDEHGRGVQLVSLLADRWAIRPTVTGKAVWCAFPLS